MQALGLPAMGYLTPTNGNIKHVMYIQFDDVHFTRDNSNAPWDLEQMLH